MAEPGAEERRRELWGLLGDLPDRTRRPSARKISEEERPGYVLEKLVLDLNGIEPVPAWFVKPKKLSGRAPAILYNHAHGGNYKLGNFTIGFNDLQIAAPGMPITVSRTYNTLNASRGPCTTSITRHSGCWLERGQSDATPTM